MTFGEKLYKLRKERGLSQEDLAVQITVSRQTVSRWEQGASLPDAENILQLCKLFGISADYLMNERIEKDSDIPIVQKTLAAEEEKKYMQMLKAYRIMALVFGVISVLVLFLTIQSNLEHLGVIMWSSIILKCSVFVIVTLSSVAMSIVYKKKLNKLKGNCK